VVVYFVILTFVRRGSVGRDSMEMMYTANKIIGKAT
jgi:hypothetical protein